MSYKIQYIIMHLLQSKHSLPLFFKICINLCSLTCLQNLSVHVVKRFQPKVGSKISFMLTWYFLYFFVYRYYGVVRFY